MAGELTIIENADGTATINFPSGGEHTVGNIGGENDINSNIAALQGAYGGRIGEVQRLDTGSSNSGSNNAQDLSTTQSSNYFDTETDLYHYQGKTYSSALDYSKAVQQERLDQGLEIDETSAAALSGWTGEDDLEQTGGGSSTSEELSSTAEVDIGFEEVDDIARNNNRVHIINRTTGEYLLNEDGSKWVGNATNAGGSIQVQKFYTQQLINSVLADSDSTVLQDAEVTYYMEDGKWRAKDQYGNIGAKRATKDAALATYNRHFNVGMKTAETAEQKAALMNITQELSLFGGMYKSNLIGMVAGSIDPYLSSDFSAKNKFIQTLGLGTSGGTGNWRASETPFYIHNNPDNEISYRKVTNQAGQDYYYLDVYSPEGVRVGTLHQNFAWNASDYITGKMRYGLSDEKMQTASKFLFENQGNYGGGTEDGDRLTEFATMTGEELKADFLARAGTQFKDSNGNLVQYDQDYRGFSYSPEMFSAGFEDTMQNQLTSRVNYNLALFDVYDVFKPRQYTADSYIAEINNRLGLDGKLSVKNVGSEDSPFYSYVYQFDTGETLKIAPNRDFIFGAGSEIFRSGSRTSTPYWLLEESDGDFQTYSDLKEQYGIRTNGFDPTVSSSSGGGQDSSGTGSSGSGSGSSDQDQSQGGGGGSGSVGAGGSGGQIIEGDGTTKTATTFQGGYTDPVAVGNTGATGATQTGTVQSGQSLTNAINNPANVSVAGTYPMAQQTGTNQATTNTGTLSSLPTTYQYKDNYTGTNMQNLTQASQGVSGPRSVLYRNDYGQEMMITVDANGTPLIYVPPGYKPVTASAKGSLQRDPQKSSEDIYLRIARKVMNFQGNSSDLKKAMAASPAMAAKLGSMTNALMNMGGVKLGASEGTDSDGMTAEEIAAANVDNIGNAIGAETFQNMQKDVVTQTMTGPRQGTVNYLTADENDLINANAGQAVNQAEMANVATADKVTQANTPISADPVGYDATQVQDDITTANQNLTGVTGTLGTQSQVDAQQQTTSSVTGLQGAEGQSVDVTGAPTRTLQTGENGELVTGTGVDQSKVDATFGTGEVAAASVQDELAGLMQQFEGGDTPAWAAGSMRKASAMLAARGIGASSMAGQAVIQAAMEAALPIAQIDTANKQQMAMFKAEQRAKFLGMEFDQSFQAKVMNAAKVSEIANMNFTAEQQIALENSRAANTMAMENLRNDQAMIMAEAAALSQLDMANLNNRQQAAVQNAQNFLQMDMANLNNLQQTAMFKAQQIAQAIFTDQAADNAAKQFNAVNENQTNQFFANLSTQVSQFNASQANAMDQFNLNSTNALRQFNAEQQNQREMFNAQNGLVVAQANAQWRQNIATLNSATQNESNMQFAQTMNGFTATNLDEIWQRERDLLSMAFKVSEGNADRATEVVLQKIAAQANRDAAELQANLEAEKNTGSFIKEVILGITGLG